MAGPDAGAVVAVEVLMEQDVVTEMLIGLEFRNITKNRSLPGLVPKEDVRESPRDFLGNLPQIHQVAGAGRAFHLEVVPVIVVKLLQRLDQKVVDRKPNWASPVGVSAEKPRGRFGRLIIDAMLGPIHLQYVRHILEVTGKSADAVR